MEYEQLPISIIADFKYIYCHILWTISFNVVASSNRKAIAEKLIGIVSKEARKVPDYRPDNGHDKISLHDAIMCSLAVMHLKYPSLLQFDRDCKKNADKLVYAQKPVHEEKLQFVV